MADPALSLHKALLSALGGLSCPVHDGMSQGTPYPYVTLDTSTSSNMDLLTTRLDERFVYLSVWSEARGQAEVLGIMGEIDTALHGQRLVLDSGTVVALYVDRKSTTRDADDVTFTGQVALRVLTTH